MDLYAKVSLTVIVEGIREGEQEKWGGAYVIMEGLLAVNGSYLIGIFTAYASHQ